MVIRLALECRACSARLDEYERPAGICHECGFLLLSRAGVRDSLLRATNAALKMTFGAMHKPPREDA